jgi:hypothetical protein
MSIVVCRHCARRDRYGTRVDAAYASPTIRRATVAQHSGSNHHRDAAEHYEHAARHHQQAAKHHDAGDHEKAAYHAYVAQAHHTLALLQAEEAMKHYASAHAPQF